MTVKVIRGVCLGEFYSEGCNVKFRPKNSELWQWETIALLRSPKQASKIAAQLNEQIKSIGN
ncbi:MAG: hypothetical protein QNJ68_07925 [Microcoleaceae cyanobacterium MO_207.B10]|nr:hypothetical protein [Microcoleaceae cyanobacterium MO_207.B10]